MSRKSEAREHLNDLTYTNKQYYKVPIIELSEFYKKFKQERGGINIGYGFETALKINMH